MKRVLCLLTDGFEETEALATVDILRRANIQVDLVSMNQLEVTGSHDIRIVADKLFDGNLAGYDLLFLPGGQPGTNHLKSDPRVLGVVRNFHQSNRFVCAICAAPSILDTAQILKGKKVTSHASVKNEYFKDAIYLEENVVVDEKIITSRGVGTVFEFAFVLVELLGQPSEPLKKSMMF